MRLNEPVVDRERIFPDGQRLISATDARGVIVYCNDEFVAVSGFERDQLVGSPHNIVRHPDMPEAVFEHMWGYLKSGRPWMGIIKNRCNNGEFYWVSAYVTPISENGRIVGYESVRVRPENEQVQRASRLYARMQAGDRVSLTAWQSKLEILPLLGTSALVLAMYSIGPGWGVAVAILALLGLQLWHHWRQERLLQHLQSSLDGAFDSKLIAQTYTTLTGKPAQLQMALLSERARIRTLLSRLKDYAGQNAALACRSGELAGRAESAMQGQRGEADMAATAIHEMATSIAQVAEHVHHTADEARQVNELAHSGYSEADNTRALVETLAHTVAGMGDSVEALAQDTQSIQQAADMIRAIAEQTNLLALNAAIEAARAGDQGRGFAVVADEVRALASKTQESTTAIQSILQALYTTANEAVAIAQAGRLEANAGVQQVIVTQQALQGIRDAIDSIHGLGQQMAAASTQQAHVAEDISRQVVHIAQVADLNTELAVESARVGAELEQTAQDMHTLVERFSR